MSFADLILSFILLPHGLYREVGAMPLNKLLFSTLLLCLLCSYAYAEDDYDFDLDDSGSEDSETGSTPTDDGGDDFNFDDPVGGGGGGSGGVGAVPDFLKDSKKGDSDSLPISQKGKSLTESELEEVRKLENERVWVLQRRPFLKSDRFELNTQLGQNINDPLVNLYTLGGQVNYYLNEQMAIGLRGTYTLNTETNAFDDVVQDYQVFPQVSRPIWSSSLNFQYVPVYGKFSLFQTWIFPWELSVRGGLGWLQTFIDGHVLVTLGAGQQFFLNRWLAFNIDLDYQVFQEVTSANSNEGALLNNLILGAGLSIYFPLDFEYKELK